MGVKRPLEEENLPELSFEQPTQLDSNKKQAFLREDILSDATALEVDSPEEENLPELSFTQPMHLDNNKRQAFLTENTLSNATALEVDSPEDENLPELSFPQPTPLDNNKKQALLTEDILSNGTALEVDSPGDVKRNFCELDSNGVLESGGACGTVVADKGLESLSFVTSSSNGEEAVGNKESYFPSNFPRCLDFDMPWRPPDHFDDPYIYFLNIPPRKVVPVGPDHQAEVPKWDPSASGKNRSSNNSVDNDWEQKLMGTCIIPLPDLNDSNIDGFTVGRGRTDCTCEDMGSVRCVQQHVKEAREKLRDAIGDEAFTKLGFYEMGEEIASKWTADEEKLFREVVVNNPASHGSFWVHLRYVFPTQTKKELVSYYFNVFVLRKRGVQNRSSFLRIDSDNDEEPQVVNPDYRRTQPLPDEDTEDDDDDLQFTQEGPDYRQTQLLPDEDAEDDVDDLQFTQGGFHPIGEGDDYSELESSGNRELEAGWVDDEFLPESEDEGGAVNLGSSDVDVPKKDDVDDSSNGGTCDSNVPKKDDVDEGSKGGTCHGSIPKQDAAEMDVGAEQVVGQETK